MSKDRMKLLEEEIENLRKENSHLRTALKVKKLEGENGQSVISQEKLDSTVKALARQLDELREFHASIGKALERSQKVESSMEALIPALELQIRGHQREIDQLNVAAEDTAETYAGIVANLEKQLKESKENHATEQENLQEKHNKEVESLKNEIASLTLKISEHEVRKREPESIDNSDRDSGVEPFTSLSIFVD